MRKSADKDVRRTGCAGLDLSPPERWKCSQASRPESVDRGCKIALPKCNERPFRALGSFCDCLQLTTRSPWGSASSLGASAAAVGLWLGFRPRIAASPSSARIPRTASSVPASAPASRPILRCRWARRTRRFAPHAGSAGAWRISDLRSCSPYLSPSISAFLAPARCLAGRVPMLLKE